MTAAQPAVRSPLPDGAPPTLTLSLSKGPPKDSNEE